MLELPTFSAQNTSVAITNASQKLSRKGHAALFDSNSFYTYYTSCAYVVLVISAIIIVHKNFEKIKKCQGIEVPGHTHKNVLDRG